MSAFPRDGQYQLYCAELMQDGRGALDEAFEKLRRRLEAEGLFSREHKRPLPRYPRKIALVTSPAGGASRADSWASRPRSSAWSGAASSAPLEGVAARTSARA